MEWLDVRCMFLGCTDVRKFIFVFVGCALYYGMVLVSYLFHLSTHALEILGAGGVLGR